MFPPKSSVISISSSSCSNNSDVVVLENAAKNSSPRRRSGAQSGSQKCDTAYGNGAARETESDEVILGGGAIFETRSCLAIRLSLLHYGEDIYWQKFAALYEGVKVST